jgi:hypothetical protein
MEEAAAPPPSGAFEKSFKQAYEMACATHGCDSNKGLLEILDTAGGPALTEVCPSIQRHPLSLNPTPKNLLAATRCLRSTPCTPSPHFPSLPVCCRRRSGAGSTLASHSQLDLAHSHPGLSQPDLAPACHTRRPLSTAQVIIKGNSPEHFHQRIGDPDVEALVAAFTQHGFGHVRTIDLSWNNITDKGCQSLAGLLRASPQVAPRAPRKGPYRHQRIPRRNPVEVRRLRCRGSRRFERKGGCSCRRHVESARSGS